MLLKRDWFWIFFALIAAWGIDRYTKIQALSLTGIKEYGNLILSLHYNPGAILGLFSQLPSVLRIVTLSTGGAFLIFTFLMLQYLIPARAMALRIGMSLLLGGIIGNVTDRIAWGHVVDFISFRYGNQMTPIFNFADAIQWVGHILVMYSLLRHADLFWPETDTRKTKWINLRFQLKYCFILMSIGLGMGVVAGTLSYTYLRVTLLTLTGENQAILDRYLVPFVLSLIAINGMFIGLLFLVGKLISLRVAGPVYAFERFIMDLLKGKLRTFQVRRSDEFQHLNQLGEMLYQHFAPSHQPQKDSELPNDPEKQDQIITTSPIPATTDPTPSTTVPQQQQTLRQEPPPPLTQSMATQPLSPPPLRQKEEATSAIIPPPPKVPPPQGTMVQIQKQSILPPPVAVPPQPPLAPQSATLPPPLPPPHQSVSPIKPPPPNPDLVSVSNPEPISTALSETSNLTPTGSPSESVDNDLILSRSPTSKKDPQSA